MRIKLWDIVSSIEEAHELLGRASEDALKASGYFPSRPGELGWPAMVDLSDALARLADQLESIIPAEIAEAIEQERRDDEEMADRADGLSY